VISRHEIDHRMKVTHRRISGEPRSRHKRSATGGLCRHRSGTNFRGIARFGGRRASHKRSGVSTLDYILVLGVIFPMVAVLVPMGKRMIQLVYEMTCVLIAWPFM